MNESTTLQKTHHAYRKAFAWGGAWLVTLTIGFTLFYGQFSAEGFGRFFGMTMLPSAICGYMANRSKMPWTFWKIGGIYLLIALAVWVLSSPGLFNRQQGL